MEPYANSFGMTPEEIKQTLLAEFSRSPLRLGQIICNEIAHGNQPIAFGFIGSLSDNDRFFCTFPDAPTEQYPDVEPFQSSVTGEPGFRFKDVCGEILFYVRET